MAVGRQDDLQHFTARFQLDANFFSLFYSTLVTEATGAACVSLRVGLLRWAGKYIHAAVQ